MIACQQMNHLVVIILLIVMTSGIAGPAPAHAKKKKVELTWIHWDDPPIFIFSGPYRGQGLLDTIERILREHLPEYQHLTVEGTVPRILKEAELKTPICNAGWLETPGWSKLFYFSKPVGTIPTNGVLIKESLLKEVEGFQSLQTFLDKKPNWKLGVGRLYGEGIDEILTKNNYQKNPQIITVGTSLRAHRMLHSDRIQYTLGYPFEAVYYNKLLEGGDKVVHVPLKDNSSFVNVVVACPKTEWGLKVINDVNKVLEKKKVLPQFSAALERWLSAEDIKRLEAPQSEMLKKFYP